MTGTLSSIPLSQQVDENGLPLSGCRLFLYAANTSTPIIAYRDFALSAGQEHPNPIVANALGRIPMFWMPDGFYRARLEDRYGTIIFDEPYMAALSTGGGGGGGGVVENPAWTTGDFIWQPVSGVKTGWVRANAKTIGNALSGATERANADTSALFAYLWSHFGDTLCPVSGGRGASAAADYDANKVIGLYDMRGFFAAGLDGMGNSLSNRFVNTPVLVGGSDVAGGWMGGNSHVLAAAEGPYHNHGAVTALNITLVDPGHRHGYYKPDYGYGNIYAGGTPGIFSGGGHADQVDLSSSGVYLSAAAAATTIDFRGGNTAHNNVPLAALGTWFIRL